MNYKFTFFVSHMQSATILRYIFSKIIAKIIRGTIMNEYLDTGQKQVQSKTIDQD